MNCLNFKIWPELEPIKSLSRGWFLIFNFQLVSKQPVHMTSKSSDICYKWWSNTKFLVFAMLFLKDNIITMLTPENDSLLAYNASCWASTRSSRRAIWWRSACLQIDSAPRDPPFIILLHVQPFVIRPIM